MSPERDKADRFTGKASEAVVQDFIVVQADELITKFSPVNQRLATVIDVSRRCELPANDLVQTARFPRGFCPSCRPGSSWANVSAVYADP